MAIGFDQPGFNGSSSGVVMDDKFTALGAVTRNVDAFEFSLGYEWQLNGGQYANTVPFEYTPAPATVGFYRSDIAYVTQDNKILYLAGVENATAGLPPDVPVGCMLLGTWSVSGNTIGDFVEILTEVIFGSGTVNQIPKFSPNGYTLGNSNFSDDGSYGRYGISGGQFIEFARGGQILKLARAQSNIQITLGVNLALKTTIYSTQSLEGLDIASDGDFTLSAGGIVGNPTTRIFIDKNTGFVCIGTQIPTQKLDVIGNIRNRGLYYDETNSSGTLGQVLRSTGTGTLWGGSIPLGKIKMTDLTSQIGNDLASFHNYISTFYDGVEANITNEIYYNGVYYFDLPVNSSLALLDGFCGVGKENVQFEDPTGIVTQFVRAFEGNTKNNVLGNVTTTDRFFKDSTGNNTIGNVITTIEFLMGSTGNNVIGNVTATAFFLYNATGDNIMKNVTATGEGFLESSTGNNTMETINVGVTAFKLASPTKKNTIYKIQTCDADFAFDYTGRMDVGLWGNTGIQNLPNDIFTTANLVWIRTFYSNNFNNASAKDADVIQAAANIAAGNADSEIFFD